LGKNCHLLSESTGTIEAGITQRLWPKAGDFHGASDFMSSLIKITIRVSLVLGLSLSNGSIAMSGMTDAFDESCSPDRLLDCNTSIFSSGANNKSEDETYEPGDVGSPKRGEGAGSR
jgi:hypothetical protein